MFNVGDMVRTQDNLLGKIVKIRNLGDSILIDVKCNNKIITTNILTVKSANNEKYRWRK